MGRVVRMSNPIREVQASWVGPLLQRARTDWFKPQ